MQKNLIFEQEDANIDLIVESMIEGMYGIDNDGNCTFINKAATQMLGYTREECMGKNMHSLIHSKHKNGNDYPETECPITKNPRFARGLFC